MSDIKSIRWSGIHRGINYEICSHMLDYDRGPWWNTYIHLNTQYNKEYVQHLWSKSTKRHKRYNGKYLVYHVPNPILESLPWNGGQTFYKQKKDGDFSHIQVGDDYQHSWDYERSRAHLDLDFMVYKCKLLIDALIKAMDQEGIKNEASVVNRHSS